MLLGRDAKLVVERVVPDLFHGVDWELYGGSVSDLLSSQVVSSDANEYRGRRFEMRVCSMGVYPLLCANSHPVKKNTHLFHVIPVRHDAVLDGVLQGQDTALALRLVPDVRILLAHTDHHALVPGATHDGGEHRPRSVVAGETSLLFNEK